MYTRISYRLEKSGGVQKYWEKKKFELDTMLYDDEKGCYKFKAKCGNILIDFTLSTFVYKKPIFSTDV